MDNKMKFSYAFGEVKTSVSMSANITWCDAADRFVEFLQAAGYVVDKGEVGAYLLGEHPELSYATTIDSEDYEGYDLSDIG